MLSLITSQSARTRDRQGPSGGLWSWPHVRKTGMEWCRRHSGPLLWWPTLAASARAGVSGSRLKSRLGESNPRPTHYERVTTGCYRGRDATDVAVRRMQLLAVVGCSRSFGGIKGHDFATCAIRSLPPLPPPCKRPWGLRASPEGIDLGHQPSHEAVRRAGPHRRRGPGRHRPGPQPPARARPCGQSPALPRSAASASTRSG